MVNDLERLNQVIVSLEEQATGVKEFNGVLASVNEARSEIETSKTMLANASAEHQKLVSDSHSKFDELLNHLVGIEQLLADLNKGQDKCLRKISGLKVLTPQRFEKGRKASDATIIDSVRKLEQKFDEANQVHQSTISNLKLITIFGYLVLAVGVAFFKLN